jgi:hypothetical protein
VRLVESSFRGAWSSGLGRRPFKPKIAGSNPVAPTDSAALALGRREAWPTPSDTLHQAECVQCTFDASKAAASAGGAAGATGLLAAGSAALGLRKLSGWLVARESQLLTPRRLKVITPILIWTGLLAFYRVRF